MFKTEIERDSDEESDEETEKFEWVSKTHEKAFEGYAEQMVKLRKEENALGLLEYLLKFETQIRALPSSIKVNQMTIQRFLLFLLPVFQVAERKDYGQAKALLGRYLTLLSNATEFGLQVRITSLVHLFNSSSQNSGLKALVFESLV